MKLRQNRLQAANRRDYEAEPVGTPGKVSRVTRRYGHMVQHRMPPGAAPHSQAEELAPSGFRDGERPLPFRSFLEAGFGTSLSDVQCYMGESAQTANQKMGSEAYAFGNKIAFATDAPSMELVAHEVAHTIQQTGAPPAADAVATHSCFEAEADAAAEIVVAGGRAEVVLRTAGPMVQQWGGSDHYMMGNLGGKKALDKIKAKHGGKVPSSITTNRVPIASAGDKSKGEPEIKKVVGTTVGMTTAAWVSVLDTSYIGRPTHRLELRKGKLGLGGASRIGGDYVKTPAPLSDIISDNHEGISGTGMIIAATNSNHFYPLNHAEYTAKHNAARGKAYEASVTTDLAKKKTLINDALILEGFACHFLQDSFAAGHHAPRALDAMTLGGGNTKEAYKGAMRSKTWHDFFCMLPEGLPTDQGRFHGDYYMDGNDLTAASDKTAESVFQVLDVALVGASSAAPTPVLPVPDFGKIMSDPVAGPAWRVMIGQGASDLGGYSADLAKSTTRNVGYTTSGGVKQTNAQVLNPMRKNIFGSGQKYKTAAGTSANVRAYLLAIKHMLGADFRANVHTRDDDANKVRPKKADDPRFYQDSLENYFKMYSGLARLARRWAVTASPCSKDRQIATGIALAADAWEQQSGRIHRTRVLRGMIAGRQFAAGNMSILPTVDRLLRTLQQHMRAKSNRPNVGSCARSHESVHRHINDGAGEWAKVFTDPTHHGTCRVEMTTSGKMWVRLEKLGITGFPRGFGDKGSFQFTARFRPGVGPSKPTKPTRRLPAYRRARR